ncbi:nucleotide disphospho-sugar-binding domain-containing protein [Kibdelosporangium persicum]|uniref:Desosaminyltransferase OleGI n=1 Tax=Kibdelosporangium persicum TaxID=2698649 RepID=A0ABX2F5I7_9PSEU|nr:nucleotide disphospho-sugar-binding domain-containing protein [Kibdelosporangium persicum]NRN66567.1 Desosaminyltransferase OleGI [Kibdelosporangium persicum]
MRVLLAAPPSTARLHNLMPLAWALRTSGHEVQIAGRPKFTETITTTGFVAVAAGTDGSGDRLAGESDVDDLTSYAALWRPSLVVWDAHAPAGAEVARAVGAASVRVLNPSDDDGPAGGPVPDATVNCLPPSLRAPEDTGHLPVRYVHYSGPSVIPAWLRRKPRRRRVLVTTQDAAGLSGTVLDPALFDTAARLRIELVCTLAEDQIPSGTTIPANVRFFDAVPVDAVLPTCAAIVHDGTAAQAMAALTNGLPQLAVGASGLAARIAEHGAGLVAGQADGPALEKLVDDASLPENARRLGAEMAAMPSPRELVPELARIAGSRAR